MGTWVQKGAAGFGVWDRSKAASAFAAVEKRRSATKNKKKQNENTENTAINYAKRKTNPATYKKNAGGPHPKE